MGSRASLRVNSHTDKGEVKVRPRLKNLMQKADDAFQKGNFDRAGLFANQVLREDSKNNYAISFLIRLYFKVGNEDKAVQLFETCREDANIFIYSALIRGCADSSNQRWRLADGAFLQSWRLADGAFSEAEKKGVAGSSMRNNMLDLLSNHAWKIGYSLALEKGEAIFTGIRSSCRESGQEPDSLSFKRMLWLYRTCCREGLAEEVVGKAANIFSEMMLLDGKMGHQGRDYADSKVFTIYLKILQNAFTWCDKNFILGLAENAYETALKLGNVNSKVNALIEYFQRLNVPSRFVRGQSVQVAGNQCRDKIPKSP